VGVGGAGGGGGEGGIEHYRDASCVPTGPILSQEKELMQQWRVSNEVLIPHFARMEQAKSFNASLDRQRAKAEVQLKLEAAQRRETGGKILTKKNLCAVTFKSKYTNVCVCVCVYVCLCISIVNTLGRGRFRMWQRGG
jgi:hypothetical protein